jgi:hypothetical protein
LTRFRKTRNDLPVGSICRAKAQDHAAIDGVATADAPRNAETRAVDEQQCPLIVVSRTCAADGARSESRMPARMQCVEVGDAVAPERHRLTVDHEFFSIDSPAPNPPIAAGPPQVGGLLLPHPPAKKRTTRSTSPFIMMFSRSFRSVCFLLSGITIQRSAHPSPR